MFLYAEKMSSFESNNNIHKKEDGSYYIVLDAQADLSLHRAHRSFCWFCHVTAQIL